MTHRTPSNERHSSKARHLFFKVVFAFLLLASSVDAQWSVHLAEIGRYESGIFAAGGAEIVTYDADSERLFVVNALLATVYALDISDPANPELEFTIDVTPFGAVANSVSAHDGTIAIAVQNATKTAPGKIVFFDCNGNYESDVTVGSLPDMVTFSPNGKYVVVANEGEPNDAYTTDPEGSISIIRIKDDADDIEQSDVKTVGFGAYNTAPLDESVRIFGPGASVAQDLEPEFITISKNSRTAWVVLQENNAIAVVDLKKARIRDIVGLGFKDHSLPGNGFDASNRDGKIDISQRPTMGMYQPDAIANFRSHGRTWLITANEGDSRDWSGFSEETRVKDLILDPTAFPNAATLQLDENLGRLKTTTANGDTDGDGDFDKIYSYGARSFSIWDSHGKLVYDSGDALEKITAAAFPDNFNSDDEENGSFDDRSDDKGPEPEGVAVGRVRGRQYAFIGLERIGGVVVYDVTNPHRPAFIEYVNNRDFSGNPEAGTSGDLSPEGIIFIPKKESPSSRPLLVVGNEVSGTTTIYEVRRARAAHSKTATEGDVTWDETEGLPTALALHQNYPNPFNPSTTIPFSLPEAAKIRVRVVDMTGRTVATLTDRAYAAGNHALQFQADDLSSGLYMYALEVDGVVRQVRRLTLLK